MNFVLKVDMTQLSVIKLFFVGQVLVGEGWSYLETSILADVH